MKLDWSPRALRQLEHQMNYIAQHKPVAAWRVYELIVQKAELLASTPEMGHPGRKPGTYETAVVGTPFVLVYRLRGDAIQIAAVWHGRQSRSTP